jgi:hypothetical protein
MKPGQFVNNLIFGPIMMGYFSLMTFFKTAKTPINSLNIGKDITFWSPDDYFIKYFFNAGHYCKKIITFIPQFNSG